MIYDSGFVYKGWECSNQHPTPTYTCTENWHLGVMPTNAVNISPFLASICTHNHNMCLCLLYNLVNPFRYFSVRNILFFFSQVFQ